MRNPRSGRSSWKKRRPESSRRLTGSSRAATSASGKKIGIGDRLFWVTAVSPLEVKFTLPERFLGKVKNGQIVTVELADGSSAVHHTAAITQISPVVDPSSGTIEIVARLQGQVPDLRPGMLTTIHLNNLK